MNPPPSHNDNNNCYYYYHPNHSRPPLVNPTECVPRRHQQQQQQQRRFKSTFVSRHNTSLFSKDTICSYLDAKVGASFPNGGLRSTNQHVILKECPFCNKPTNGKADNMFKLYIKIGDGAYFCHRCGSKGSWFDFKKNLGGGGDMVDHVKPFFVSKKGNDSAKLNSFSPMPNERLAATYISNLLDATTDNVHAKQALEYLTEVRCLTKPVLRKYGVGLGVYNFPSAESGLFTPSDCITFPWIMRASEISEQETLKGNTFRWRDVVERQKKPSTAIAENDGEEEEEKLSLEDEEREKINRELGPWMTRRIKARSIDSKANQRLDPPGGGWGLFGWHTVPSSTKELVLTEGEYDAMAVYQATGRAAVSLPNGCRSLPVEILPLLERFDKIVLWCDNDGPGQEGAEQFARKIGLGRCVLVRPPGPNAPKDANDALREGHDLEELIQRAQVVPHENILTFSEIREQVIHEICNPHEYAGTQISSLPTLTNILKGVRRGEMTVITGPTGSGKTTFLSQLSLDFAEEGVNCLWGSFEVKNTKLMLKLLRQFAREPLPKSHDLLSADGDAKEILEGIADRFSELPLHFMRFHGGSEVDDIVDAMEYAVYVHDVEHIILDNLQFMMNRNLGKGAFDKFDAQDMAVDIFRKFATRHNVHVTLVVHPRKEDEGLKLSISSIYGSAKATQEADTVLILQSDGRRKYIEVKKNRYDGTLGYCPLHFNFETGRYSEDIEMGSPDPAHINPTPTPNRSMPRNRNNQGEEDELALARLGQKGIDNLFSGSSDPNVRTYNSMSPAAAALYQRKNNLKNIDSNKVNRMNGDNDNEVINSTAVTSKLLESAIEKYK